MPEVKLVPLEQIPWEECFAFQCRDRMSEEHTQNLRVLIEESDEENQQTGAALRIDLFPPLTVFTKGGLSDLYYLADGFHRYEALTQAGRDAWLCEVHVVSDPLFSAKVFSLKANTAHGLPRDSATLRRVFAKARALFPAINLYGRGSESIQEKTGLSAGWIYLHAKWLKDSGIPDAKTIENDSKKEEADRKKRECEKLLSDGVVFGEVASRVGITKNRLNSWIKNKSVVPGRDMNSPKNDRLDERTNPNCEPLGSIDTEGLAEESQSHRGGGKLDKLKRPIPPGLLPKFNTPKINELVRKLGMMVCEIDELYGTPGFEYLDASAVGRSLRTIQNTLRAVEYYTECPRCDMDKGCKLCKGAGFITSLQHARLDDREKAALND